MNAVAGGRPSLPRYRADLVLTVEMSAEDREHAAIRLEALADIVDYRAGRMIRGARIGGSELIGTVAGNVSQK